MINWTGTALTAYMCAMLTYITAALINGTVQPTFRDVVIGLVGFITAKLSTVFDFHYGTSSASKKQQDTIASQADTIATTAAQTAPVPDKVIPVKPGEPIAVAAAPQPGVKK